MRHAPPKYASVRIAAIANAFRYQCVQRYLRARKRCETLAWRTQVVDHDDHINRLGTFEAKW
jgi:hypothetical protein